MRFSADYCVIECIMPLPSKQTKESKDDFMNRCLSDEESKKEFKNIKQRIAVCLSQWKKEDTNYGKPKDNSK